MAIVAEDPGSLRRAIETAREALAAGGETGPLTMPGARIFLPRSALDLPARIAFVYPGLGNVFAGMGREPSTFWPEVLREQDARNARLRDQVPPETWWNDEAPGDVRRPSRCRSWGRSPSEVS